MLSIEELTAKTHGFFFGIRGLVNTPFEVTPDDIDLAQVARNLSRICRYVGNGRHFYSVAEHSVLLSHRVAPEYAKDALFHDATEIFLGDLHSLLKKMMVLNGDSFYAELENRLYADVIAPKFGVAPVVPGPVHKEDKAFQTEEVSSLFYDQQYRLAGLTPAQAEALFLSRAHELGVPS